jgi:hypothetical protein
MNLLTQARNIKAGMAAYRMPVRQTSSIPTLLMGAGGSVLAGEHGQGSIKGTYATPSLTGHVGASMVTYNTQSYGGGCGTTAGSTSGNLLNYARNVAAAYLTARPVTMMPTVSNASFASGIGGPNTGVSPFALQQLQHPGQYQAKPLAGEGWMSY